MEKIINFLRKFSFLQNWQSILENKPAGPTQITISIIIIASIVIYNTTQTMEAFVTFRKIGFPIIAGVLLFVLAIYATGTNLLLRRHRKELDKTKGVLKTWITHYASTLLKFKYLSVKKVYEILENGTGICYRKSKIKPINSEIVLDEFDIGTIKSEGIETPNLAGMQLKAYEIKNNKSKVRMDCISIDDTNKDKIKMAVFFEPPLKSPDILTYEVSYKWKNMWKKFIEEGETSGKVTTMQETDLKILEFIVPKNYIIEGLTIVHSEPDISRNLKYKITEENGKPKLIWKIKNPPIGVIEYKIKANKLSNS